MTAAVSNPSVQRAVPVLVTGVLTLIIAWPIAHYVGFATAIDMLMYWAGGGGYIVLCLWYGIVFAFLGAAVRGTALLLRLRALAGNPAIDWLGFWFAARVRGVKNVVAMLLRLTIGLPVGIAFERIFDLVNRIEVERELRREYRKNFRHVYRTFAEFKRAYYDQNETNADETKEDKNKENETANDPQARLTEAFALLGLSESCTRKELETRYRSLMKKVHPDAGGTQVLAARVNEAKDLIMKMKGWK